MLELWLRQERGASFCLAYMCVFVLPLHVASTHKSDSCALRLFAADGALSESHLSHKRFEVTIEDTRENLLITAGGRY